MMSDMEQNCGVCLLLEQAQTIKDVMQVIVSVGVVMGMERHNIHEEKMYINCIIDHSLERIAAIEKSQLNKN